METFDQLHTKATDLCTRYEDALDEMYEFLARRVQMETREEINPRVTDYSIGGNKGVVVRYYTYYPENEKTIVIPIERLRLPEGEHQTLCDELQREGLAKLERDKQNEMKWREQVEYETFLRLKDKYEPKE